MQRNDPTTHAAAGVDLVGEGLRKGREMVTEEKRMSRRCKSRSELGIVVTLKFETLRFAPNTRKGIKSEVKDDEMNHVAVDHAVWDCPWNDSVEGESHSSSRGTAP